jgi:NADH-dependent peroxiredoxin subunit C
LAAVAAVHRDLQALNVEVLAISTDSVYSHKVFLETSPLLKNVNYPLVSDRTQEISRAYRVLDENSGASFRASFFINPDQIITSKLVYPLEVGRNIDEHVRIFQGLQYAEETGKGVPANWKPGNIGIDRDTNQIGRV